MTDDRLVPILIAVAILAVATYAMRLAGVLVGARLRHANSTMRFLDRGVVVLLMAVLVATTVYDGQEFAGWARIAGAATAAVAALLRAPILVVVLTGMGVTATLRLLGIA